MSLIYRNIYTLMCDILDSLEEEEIDKKTRGFSEGFKQLIQRMVKMNRAPGEMRALADLAATADEHTLPLPSDFITHQAIWIKESSLYRKIMPQEILTLEVLQAYKDTNYFDTSDTGIPRKMAIDGDQIVCEHYFESDDSTAGRISYWQYPAEVTAYDQIGITGASGTFTVGESITGSDSSATAEVTADNGTTLYLKSSSVSGDFVNGEAITGDATPTVSATTSSILTQKVQVLELGEKYKLALATAGATLYLFMQDSISAADKDAVLDNIIEELGDINRSGTIRVRPSR